MSSSWPAAERPSHEAVAARRALLDAEAAGDLDAVRAGLDHDDDRVRASAVAIGHRLGVWTSTDLALVAGDASLQVRHRAPASLAVGHDTWLPAGTAATAVSAPAGTTCL